MTLYRVTLSLLIELFNKILLSLQRNIINILLLTRPNKYEYLIRCSACLCNSSVNRTKLYVPDHLTSGDSLFYIDNEIIEHNESNGKIVDFSLVYFIIL